MIEVKLSGRYRLDAKIAEGGIGSVWRATDEVLDRTVAIKTLRPHLAADGLFRERFRLESLSAARLTHPNIVAIYDTGEGEGLPFLVMEYLEAGTLRRRLDSELRLSPGTVARISLEVCAALEHAHANGIIHGDLKPSNVLFADSGHAKVADFCLAGPGPDGDAAGAAAPEDLERSGPLMGTVRYLSPEQLDGAAPDARSDIYSLGLVMYEALTGHAPFAGSSDLTAAVKRQAAVPARPQRLRPDVPRPLDELVVRALQPSPDDRFADAAQMRRALAALVLPEAADDEARIPVPVSRSGDEDSFVKTEGRWLLPSLLSVLLVGALVIALNPGIVSDLPRLLPGAGPRPEAAAISVAGRGTFDPRPEGDGSEHDEETAWAYDRNPETHWRTTSYRTRDFGGLKPGVGIWFDAGKPVSLEEIRVVSVAGGWQGTIRTSDDKVTWSEAGPSQTAGQQHAFPTFGSGEHRYWMVWITRLTATPGAASPGNPFGVAISEIEPIGR